MSIATQPKDKFIDINGLGFHYLDWGNLRKPTLLLLHGGGQTAWTWEDAAPLLRPSYHVLALDQRGHGESAWAPDSNYSTSAYVQDVYGFTEAMKLKPFFLLGMSMGGMNAISFTARYSKKVQALVIVDVGPEVSEEGTKAIRAFQSKDVRDTFEDFLGAAKKFNPLREPENLRKRLTHSLKQRSDGKWTWKQDPKMREQASENLPRNSQPLWQAWRAIRCPTLVIRGGESKVLTDDILKKMLETLSGSRAITIPGAGHSVQGDKPGEFAQAVLEFLESLGRSQPVLRQ